MVADNYSLPLSQGNQMLNFQIITNYKNPKSLKVGYWRTKIYLAAPKSGEDVQAADKCNNPLATLAGLGFRVQGLGGV